MIDQVKPIAHHAASLQGRPRILPRIRRYVIGLGAALIIGLSPSVHSADHPQAAQTGIRSVLQQPVIKMAEPMSLWGIETENSNQVEPVVRQADEMMPFEADDPIALPVEKLACPNRLLTRVPVSTAAGGRRTEMPQSPVLQAEARPAQTLQVSALHQPQSLPSLSPVRAAGNAGSRPSHDPGIKPMRDIRIDITPPTVQGVSGDQRSPKDFASEVFQDQPPFPRDPPPNGPWFSDVAYGPPLNFCYRPLYFEEANFERYGRTAGILQPLVSAGRFYGGVAVLPYRLAAQRPGFCTYYEHCYRPGAPAPRE